MEEFEGNGAECMVRFINGGFNGTIFRAGLQSAFLNKRIWEEERDTYSLSWLSEPATYCPPEPQYKDARLARRWMRGWLGRKCMSDIATEPRLYSRMDGAQCV